MVRTDTATFFIALCAATTLHLALLLTVQFTPPPRPLAPEAMLEVMLLPERQPAPPVAAAPIVLAAQSQPGTAPLAPTAPATSPTPPAKPTPSTRHSPSRSPPPAALIPPPLAAVVPTEITPLLPLDPLSVPAVTTSAVTTAQIFASQDAETSQLNQHLETRPQHQVRRQSISASTREFRYANYLGAWARKVERIGNLNYPAAAREQNLSGSLIVHVAIRADGSIETIRIVRSSGVPLLDQAALAIVKLAAPYAPFPPDIAADTDVLDIIRTWQFQRGGTLGWERSR